MNNNEHGASGTRREVARQTMRYVKRLPECFVIDAEGHLHLGDLQLAPEPLGEGLVGTVYRTLDCGSGIAIKVVPVNDDSGSSTVDDHIAALPLPDAHSMRLP